ncbi:MAG TPA: hypothetical protein VNK52_16220 [Hyphomicrobiaceae bacterium]|nr:hypothetical protein [Hyphomicrobiaceae bacterium]
MTATSTDFPNPFLAYMRARCGTDRWCVASRLTPRLRAKGYERAIPKSVYLRWSSEYEREEGRMRDAALELYSALRMVNDNAILRNMLEPRERRIVDAALAKAEGRHG